MYQRLHQARSTRSRKGFTIVELLIVIVVIGILAAITLVAFNGIRLSAGKSVIKSDLEQAVKTAQNDKTLNHSYPASASLANNGTGFKTSEGTTLEYTYTSGEFCMTVSSSIAQTSYYVQSPAMTMLEGVCPGHVGYSSGGVTPDIIGLGGLTTCRLLTTTLYCWGQGTLGQIGNGVASNVLSPTLAATSNALLSGKTVTLLGTNAQNTCVIASAAPYCWGSGYLGDGSYYASMTAPVAVTVSGVLAGKTITDLTVSLSRACVIASGAPYCWGGLGPALGNGAGSTTSYTSPIAVDATGVLAGKTATKIVSSNDAVCVLASGAPYCWGENDYGQLGNGGTTDSNVPVAVTVSGVLNGKTITDIAMGGNVNADTVCVIADSAPFCWGFGGNGQIGNGTTTSTNSLPVATTTSGVLSGKTVTDVDIANEATCVIASEAAYCWGSNTYNQIGDNTSLPRTSPVAVYASGALSGKTMSAISASVRTFCALDTENAMYCWGRNNNGQLGNGGTTNSPVPILVSVP
jgi:prepilin-type N-terminal cleavage/methylation domain-containing protein